MTVTEAITETVNETVESIELPAVLHRFPLQPRCRVCRNDEVRTRSTICWPVALATRWSCARSNRTTQARHARPGHHRFDPPPHQAALPGAERREGHLPPILERRAQENGVDFVKGVATAITPMAFFETVMAKGYETLVDSGTKVEVNTGMVAAARLQALIESRAGGPESPTSWCRWVASSTRSTPRCPKSCGRRSCARSMDRSRLNTGG